MATAVTLMGMTTAVLPPTPFTLDDLPTIGLTPRQLRRECEQGRVRRLHRRVYVDSAVEDSVTLRATSLSLVVAPHQIVVDRTAAWLHGVDTFALVELRDVPPVEVCTLRGRARTRLTGVRGRERDLSEADIMVLNGIRVTTPLRTALDLGCHLRRREAYAALCGLAREHDLETGSLLAGADRFARRRGVLQLRDLIPLVDPRIESPREAWTLLAVHDAGLPLPEPQVWIDVDGVATYRLDFAYRERRIALEYDGEEWHDRTEEQRRADADRRSWLRRHGWTIITIRLGDFTGEALDAWLRELRAALATTYTSRRW